MKGTDRSNLATLALLGMLSGAVAWALIKLTGEGSYARTLRGAQISISSISVLPGLVFGLTVGFLWHRRSTASHLVVLGYMLAAGVAYFLAFHVALNVFDRISDTLSEDRALVLSGIIAGLIGCCSLGLATTHLLHVPYQSALGMPVVVGSAASAMLPLINIFGDWDGGFLIFLVLWQGAYGASLHQLRPGSIHRR